MLPCSPVLQRGASAESVPAGICDVIIGVVDPGGQSGQEAGCDVEAHSAIGSPV